jgi:hypothetical protein
MWEYKLLLRVLSIRISIELTCIGGRMKPGSPPIWLFSNCIQPIHMQRAPTYAIFVNQILQRALRHDSRFYVSWLEGCQNSCLGQTKPNFLFHVAAVGVIVPWSLALKFRNDILPPSSGQKDKGWLPPKTYFNCDRAEPFWVIMQRVMAISYRRFGTSYHIYFKCRVVGYQHSGESMYCFFFVWIVDYSEHMLGGGKAPSWPHSAL